MNKIAEVKPKSEQLFYDFITIINILRKDIISGKLISTALKESTPKLKEIRDKLSSNKKYLVSF